MSSSVMESHAPDDVLVRYIDGVSEGEERHWTEAHLATCTDCAHRLETLRRRSAGLSSMLAEVAVPAPRWVRPQPDVIELQRARVQREAKRTITAAPWLRAAAVVLLVLGVGTLVSPLRALVADWLRQQWEQLAGEPALRQAPPVTPAPSPVPAPPASSTRVRFSPEGDVLVLNFAVRPTAGTATFAVHAGSSVEVEMIGGGDVLVLPEQVRIENRAAPAASYRIRVPGTLDGVSLRMPGAGSTEVDVAEIPSGGERVLELGPGSR